jgi:hypothetical protein
LWSVWEMLDFFLLGSLCWSPILHTISKSAALPIPPHESTPINKYSHTYSLHLKCVWPVRPLFHLLCCPKQPSWRCRYGCIMQVFVTFFSDIFVLANVCVRIWSWENVVL